MFDLFWNSRIVNPAVSPAVGWIAALVAALLIFLLIVLIEMTVLQLLRWGTRREVLRAALIMNFFSTLINLVLLVVFPSPPVWGLAVAWLVSVWSEGCVLVRIRAEPAVLNRWGVVLANLASYLILILPAYLRR